MIGEAYASQARAQEELIKQAEKLDESQKKIAATLLDHHKILVDNTVAQVQYAREVQLSENAVIKNSVGKEDYSKTVKFLLDEMTSEYSKAGLFSSLQSNLFGDFSEFDLITKDNAKKISDNINIIIEKFGILNDSLDENKTKLQTTFGEVGANALAKFYKVI